MGRARPVPGQLSRTELLTTTGIDGKLLDELEAYGLVSARSLGQQAVYDGAARQICEIAGACGVGVPLSPPPHAATVNARNATTTVRGTNIESSGAHPPSVYAPRFDVGANMPRRPGRING